MNIDKRTTIRIIPIDFPSARLVFGLVLVSNSLVSVVEAGFVATAGKVCLLGIVGSSLVNHDVIR